MGHSKRRLTSKVTKTLKSACEAYIATKAKIKNEKAEQESALNAINDIAREYDLNDFDPDNIELTERNTKSLEPKEGAKPDAMQNFLDALDYQYLKISKTAKKDKIFEDATDESMKNLMNKHGIACVTNTKVYAKFK